MRLLHFDDHGELCLTKNLINDIPPYAILSHTWGAEEDEVEFSDVQNKTCQSKAGYTKIQFCGQQAQKDGISYFWIDTCCIKKSDSSELAEAIVSMFKWYRDSVKCYAFLSDVAARKRRYDSEGTDTSWELAFRDSRWFTRGWTLQELLAPDSVEFFSKEWDHLGDKKSLEQVIHKITTVPEEAFRSGLLDHFSDAERLRWAEKRTTTRTEDKAYCLQGIFDVNVPPVYGEGEEAAFDRLKDAINKSHRKYLDRVRQSPAVSRPSCPGQYSTRPISTQAESVLPHDHRKLLLTSLSFEQMTSRESTIKKALATTCRWFLKHPIYSEWIDPRLFRLDRSFLWIHGKPGAGKSTLVKFAHAHASKERSEDEVIVSFFFNARGDELEKSTIGMYRSLLYQLLSAAPGLQRLLDNLQLVSQDSSQPPTWTIDMLCELLSAAVKGLGQQKVKCFVDALDECDEQEVQEMVLFFEELGQVALEAGGQLRVCFASRYYPTIDVRNGRQLRLEDESGHVEDLVKYIRKHLRTGESEYAKELQKQVQEKANGIFMWTVLVVDILNKEFRRGRVFTLQQRLQEIPDKLSDLFKDILRRDADNLDDLLLCLQWILFANRPLSREEFYFAMMAGLGDESMAEWNVDRITINDMDRFLLSSSKGLAELTKSKEPTVQFIHESVRDFLIKDNGLCELWPQLGTDVHGLSHDRLKQCCQSYLKIDRGADIPRGPLPMPKTLEGKEQRELLSKRFPLLAYASRYILYHADEAALSISQTNFLQSFSVRTWVEINNLFEVANVHRHSSQATLLYLLAEYGYTRLIRTWCDQRPTIGDRGERYQFPLFAALANGHQKAVKALLAMHNDSPGENLDAELEFGKTGLARQHDNPLLWALKQKHEALARILLTSTDIDSCLKGEEGRKTLLLALSNGCESVSLSLIEYGVDKDEYSVLMLAAANNCEAIVRLVSGKVDAFDRGQALLEAARGGHEPIVHLLLDRDAYVNDGKALAEAARRGHEAVVRLLLDRDAHVNKDKVLVEAIRGGHEPIVRLLLEGGADIEAAAFGGYNALERAARGGHQAVVRLLLDRGAHVNDGKALAEAAGRGHEAVARLLLDRSADTNKDWALTIAAYNGHAAVVRLLLDRGCHIDEHKVLVQAACDGHEAMVRLLLDRGADTQVVDSHGRTALTLAVVRQCESMVRLLLDRGANIDAVDNNGHTALILAAVKGDEAIVRLLSDRGANLEVGSMFGHTALAEAGRRGHEEVARILIDKGASQ